MEVLSLWETILLNIHGGELLYQGDGGRVESQAIARFCQTVSPQAELAETAAYRLRAQLRTFTPQFHEAVRLVPDRKSVV